MTAGTEPLDLRPAGALVGVQERPAGRWLQVLAAAGCLAFLVLVWGAILFHLDHRRETELSQARRDVTNLSIAMAEQVSRLIENADQVMRLIQDDYRDDPAAFDFAVWTKRATSLASSAKQIAMVDADGNLVGGRQLPNPSEPRVNVADRAYFRALAEQPDAGLQVGRTLRRRLDGSWGFVLARRLTRPDGSFGGIVVIALDPEYLAQRFSELDVGTGGSVALFGLDGYIRARSPVVSGMYERDTFTQRPDGLFATLKTAPTGSYLTWSTVDGQTRIFGYRTMGGLPLVVTIGKSVAEVLAPIRAERLRAVAIGGITTALIVGGCLVLLRELERKRRSVAQLVTAHRALADAETLFRGVFENATDHLFVHRVAVDGSFRLETLNPAASALVGRDLDAARGKTPEEVMPADMAAIVRADIEGVIGSGRTLRRQEERVRGDGSHRFEVIMVPLREPGEDRIGRVFISARDITHLRRAEERIAASEARYRLLADNASDMIVQLDLDGRRLFVSPACRALLGYDPEEIVGTRPQDGVHPEDAPRLQSLIARLGRGEADAGVSIHRLRRKDGTDIWVEGSWRLVRDAHRRPSGFVATVRDIDARHTTEEALRTSEARYRALADSLPQLVWVTRDADGEALYVNRQFETYYGPIGTSRAARVAANHPEDAPAMAEAWRVGRGSGRGYELEARLRRRDGAYRWHKLVIVPMRQADGVVGWIGTALDIDDILSDRRALADTGDLLSLAQDVAESGSWDLDLVTRTVRLSPEGARLHGLEGGHTAVLSLQLWQDQVVPEDRERTLRESRAAIDARRTLSTEFRVQRPGGGSRWVQSLGRAYYDADGRAVRMIGLNLDISERKTAEAALREAKAAADAARLDAERASVAKTDFLAAMSHEIRTPLNAVIGFTDLLARSADLAPDLRRHAEFARTAGSALLTVVDDILDFSKVEAGAIELEARPFSPEALIEAGLSIVRDLAERKGLAVRAEIDPALPGRLVGDENRLRQVLLNFLNNAVKFTRRGSVTLHAVYEGATQRGERVRFSVVDTGIGIPADKQHRLFERFSQVDSSVTRDFGGTGLGLAICRRLVELMGGTVGVSSDDGAGATFWFSVTLPRATDAPAAARPDARQVPRRTGRILLVEDVEINQELARLVLEAVGHAVEVVADGAAAVMAVEDGAFDLVLMDVQMPGMDGMTATRLIRRLAVPAARIPVIAMTANVLPDEVRAFREAGMDDHVGKPFDRGALYATIDRWLAPRPQGRAERVAGG